MAGGGVDSHLVKVMERDGDTSKRKGEAQQEELRAKRLKGTIGADAFSSDHCARPLRPPIFQCSMGHFLCCSSCRDKLLKCQICASSSLERNYGMDRAVESVLVDCRYADHGCQERTTYYGKKNHEMTCPRAWCSCPFQGCDFAGRSAELLNHLTAHHKCPCTKFRYWSKFDLRVEPGVHVLLDEDEGQVLLVSTQPIEQLQGWYAISVAYIPPCEKIRIGCSVSFSCRNRYSTCTMDHLPNLSLSDWPSIDYICIVPKNSDVRGGAGVVLKTTIEWWYPEAEEDSDHSS